jgi:hypothetical protein
MERKEFGRDNRGYVFVSDARDIGVPFSKREQVHEWATKNNIVTEYQGTLGGTDVWRVKNEKDRVSFLLRWS